MTTENYKIDISSNQAEEIFDLRSKFIEKIGYNIDKPEVWLSHHIGNYLSTLVIDAERENFGQITQKNHIQRKKLLKPFRNYFNSTPTAEHITNRLEEYVEVPDYLDELLRKDINFLQNI